MKRINIRHAGTHYSVGGRDIAELQLEIATALKFSEPYWLDVNEGEGVRRPALLLITTGMGLALIPIPEPHPAPDDTTEQPPPASAR
jgi:hypothetical protein